MSLPPYEPSLPPMPDRHDALVQCMALLGFLSLCGMMITNAIALIGQIKIEIAAPGTYAVELDCASPYQSGRNRFLLQAAGVSLTGDVPGTGSWDIYTQQPVGQITLPTGTHRLIFRSAGPIWQSMLDLRTVRLKPVAANR